MAADTGGSRDPRLGGPSYQSSSMDLRAEIQGAFQEIVLPDIKKDLSSLREDVLGMRRDLQLLSSRSASRVTGDERRSSPNVPGSALDATVGLGQDSVDHKASSDPAQQGRPNWQLRAARALSKAKGVQIVASTASNAHQDQHPAPPNYIADVTESNDKDKEYIEKEGPEIIDITETSDKEVPSTSFTFIVPHPDGGTDFQGSSERRSTKPIVDQIKNRQSLAAGKVSLALLRHSETKPATLMEWIWSLTQRRTYRGLTAARILASSRFDNVISILILGNSLTIGLEADYAARNVTDAIPWPYRYFEILFCVVFTSELALRVWVQKMSFFLRGSGSRVLWNYFDLVVVGAQLVQEGIELAKSNASDKNDAGNLRILRILRVLRIVRIFRLVRVLHLISELRTIVSSIMGSFRSLFWTVILLLLMMYIVGVWFLQSVTDHFIERPAVDSDGDYIDYTLGETQLRKHFDSLAQTILSLWQALSGGVDWSDVADPLISEVEPLLGIGFAAFIAFALLALMNVVTGVFVQTALHSAEAEEESFLTDQIIQLFHKCKNDDSWGCLSETDLEARLEDPELAKEWKNISVTADEAQYVFALLDVDEAGEVQFEEFLSACLRLKGNAKSLDMLIQLQESRHNMKVLSDKLDSISKTSDSLQGKLSQILQNEAHKSPKQPGHSGLDPDAAVM
jgi:hypothetical protein